jgi:nicotinate-nucleotide pyrophosphorylase (carboxylating)
LKKNFYKNFNFNEADYLIRLALKEDIGSGDITTGLLIPKLSESKAEILFKENGIIAGLEIFKRVFKILDKNVKVKFRLKDGDEVKKNEIAGSIKGSSRSILKGERTALNLFQRMCGIAMKTYKFKKLLNNDKIKILDTRKTTPNLRLFEKLAVKIGGGENHRSGLYDMMLIKDNHIQANGGIKNTISLLKKRRKNLKTKTEIEVQDLKELEILISEGAGVIDIVMLDNFKLEEIKEAVKMIDKKFKIEISGKVNENSIGKYGKITGIDFISIGSLTHSVESIDISLNFIN